MTTNHEVYVWPSGYVSRRSREEILAALRTHGYSDDQMEFWAEMLDRGVVHPDRLAQGKMEGRLLTCMLGPKTIYAQMMRVKKPSRIRKSLNLLRQMILRVVRVDHRRRNRAVSE